MTELVYAERIVDDCYQLTVLDPNKIMSSENPGNLSIVFNCSATHRSRHDDAQIFYTLAPAIHGTEYCRDLATGISAALNQWQIAIIDGEQPNIFDTVRPLTFDDRLALYQQRYDITQTTATDCTSASLFSLVALSKNQEWKNGILQRCVDCLVKPEFRGNPRVTAVIDENYCRLMRYILETEQPDFMDATYYFRMITSTLGLKNSHDSKIFTLNKDRCEKISNLLKIILDDELFANQQYLRSLSSVILQLDTLFEMWSGANVRHLRNNKYRLVVTPLVSEGLSYLLPYCPRPAKVIILDSEL